MKRTQEKIKDIVEPQDFDEVRNLASDPARSVSAYRFTDATSDLLARWLDALADLPRGRGAARALAGSRGVGKTHTLSVFGALAGHEPLRSQVEDAHVATSARRLSGRRHTVVRVERGTRTTLAEEMAAAFARAFGGNEIQWGADPAEMLAVAASRANDSTLVLVIDTGFERPTRVRRDDGPQLGALARAADGLSAFLALALDDDISGADGPNVAIAGSYRIDYLDHEHLYRVADTYILRKNEQARAALHDIYLHLRSTVPDFNWSEPRFSALYPVHPLVADVAAAVRLYAPGFAFLPFAAEAARRATSRPALSLVLLDEVFDRAERDLRRSPELKEAFEVYDRMAADGVARIPVMQRLEARLVLKTLFILSLDGGGATARGLCAALLVSDEASQERAVERVTATLRQFMDATPDGALRANAEEGGGELRYCLQISAADKFKAALERSVEKLPAAGDGDAAAHLRAAARARFSDWPFAAARGEETAAASVCITWRGSERVARLVWDDGAGGARGEAGGRAHEIEVVVLAPGARAAAGVDEVDASGNRPHLSAVWRPAAVSAEEAQALRRLHALRADASLVADFGDTARAAETALAAQVERAWTRVYLNEGALAVNGKDYRFGEGALAARTLAAALSESLAPRLAELYTRHPDFADALRATDVERLACGLFAGAAREDAEVQRLARAFALPLGLAELRGDACLPASGRGPQDPSWVGEALSAVGAGGAPIETAREALARPPYGLGREEQNLVLVGLVAQRRVELVCASGARVGRRDLDRPVRWDEVTAVTPAAATRLGAEELAEWARRLTGRASLAALDGADAREAVRRALSDWLREWGSLRLRESFDALPDEALTTRAWKMNGAVQKHFGAAAAAARSALADESTLEEGLEQVADAFGGDAEKFAGLARDLEALKCLIENFDRRERARAYLLTAEETGVDLIETARRELLAIARDHESLFDADRFERFKRLWHEFHARYAEHYAAAHEEAVDPSSHARRALEAFLAGERWREFESLSRVKVFNRQHWDAARTLMRRAQTPRCGLPARQMLVERASCGCSFRLRQAAALARLPRELEELAERGLASYRRTLTLIAAPLAHALAEIAAREEARRDLSMRARLLAAAFGGGSPPQHFSRVDVQLVERALAEMEAPAPVRAHAPTEDCGLLTRDELEARVRQWLDDLPRNAALVEVVGRSESNAG